VLAPAPILLNAAKLPILFVVPPPPLPIFVLPIVELLILTALFDPLKVTKSSGVLFEMWRVNPFVLMKRSDAKGTLVASGPKCASATPATYVTSTPLEPVMNELNVRERTLPLFAPESVRKFTSLAALLILLSVRLFVVAPTSIVIGFGFAERIATAPPPATLPMVVVPVPAILIDVAPVAAIVG